MSRRFLAADYNATRRKGNWSRNSIEDRPGVWQVDRVAAQLRRQRTLEEIGSSGGNPPLAASARKEIGGGRRAKRAFSICADCECQNHRRHLERIGNVAPVDVCREWPEVIRKRIEAPKHVTLEERFRYNRSRLNQITTRKFSFEL